MSTQYFNSFDKNIEESSQIFSILSDKNRLSVFVILTYGEFSVSEIFNCLKLKQNLISHHLKFLLNNGFVKNKRAGRKILYSLNKKKVQEIQLAIGKLHLIN